MTDEVPTKMNAMAIKEVGEHFELAIETRPCPSPSEDEVLIQVFAAGVNGHDVHQIHRGGHDLRPGETDLPGLEVAGLVVAVGTNVSEFSVGDRVCALLRGGGYAEYVTAPEGNCLPVPENLSWAEAAVLPETYFTVWSNVFLDSALLPDETFLMNGGTSGIGVAAIQIAATLGHKVFATAKGNQKARLCEELGAARGVDYEAESFPEVIQKETGGKGVDVILDIVAGDYLAKDLDAAAKGGRIVFIGGARGFETDINIRKLLHKQLRVGGSLLRPRSNEFKAQVRDALLEKVWPHVRSGTIRPMLFQTFALAQAAEAVECLEKRQHVGKVALIVREDGL